MLTVRNVQKLQLLLTLRSIEKSRQKKHVFISLLPFPSLVSQAIPPGMESKREKALLISTYPFPLLFQSGNGPAVNYPNNNSITQPRKFNLSKLVGFLWLADYRSLI